MATEPAQGDSILARLEQLDAFTAQRANLRTQNGFETEPERWLRRSDVLALCRAWQEEQGWRPIETAPRNERAFFWIVPKTKEEAWLDTSGDSIISKFTPRLHWGVYGSWSSLSKAIAWQPEPAPPVAAPAATEE